MKQRSHLLVLIVAPLLLAALWMDNQPTFKPYETPLPPPLAGSVPYAGNGNAAGAAERNPVAPNAASLTRGKTLFAIYCAMCHGENPAKIGPVGSKLTPPPPGLAPTLIRERSEAHIFRAISQGFGRMPPFRDRLTPPERWDLVNFLRHRD